MFGPSRCLVGEQNPFLSRPFFRVKKIKLVGWSGVGAWLSKSQSRSYDSTILRFHLLKMIKIFQGS